MNIGCICVYEQLCLCLWFYRSSFWNRYSIISTYCVHIAFIYHHIDRYRYINIHDIFFSTSMDGKSYPNKHSNSETYIYGIGRLLINEMSNYCWKFNFNLNRINILKCAVWCEWKRYRVSDSFSTRNVSANVCWMSIVIIFNCIELFRDEMGCCISEKRAIHIQYI